MVNHFSTVYWSYYLGVQDDAGGNPAYLSNGQALASDITFGLSGEGDTCFAAHFSDTNSNAYARGKVSCSIGRFSFCEV